jgi:hypothetical protein
MIDLKKSITDVAKVRKTRTAKPAAKKSATATK